VQRCLKCLSIACTTLHAQKQCSHTSFVFCVFRISALGALCRLLTVLQWSVTVAERCCPSGWRSLAICTHGVSLMDQCKCITHRDSQFAVLGFQTWSSPWETLWFSQIRAVFWPFLREPPIFACHFEHPVQKPCFCRVSWQPSHNKNPRGRPVQPPNATLKNQVSRRMGKNAPSMVSQHKSMPPKIQFCPL
jgi:hypothetical protein